MAPLFTITLFVSITGIVSLIGIKQWELAHGTLVWGRVRPQVGDFFHRVVVWVERVLPTLIQQWLRRTGRTIKLLVQRGAAHAILSIEHGLERTLHFLQHTTDVQRGAGEASVFLREVAEHKKKLLKASSKRSRVVVEKEKTIVR